MPQTMCAQCSSHLTRAEIREGSILCSKCERNWQNTVLQQFRPQLEKLQEELARQREEAAGDEKESPAVPRRAQP